MGGADWTGGWTAAQWLFNALGEASLPAVCVETPHMRAVT